MRDKSTGSATQETSILPLYLQSIETLFDPIEFGCLIMDYAEIVL